MRTPEAGLKQRANELGFGLVGIARAAEADGFPRLQEWLSRGYAGEMGYMHRHADARRHPSSVLPEVRSVVMVGMEYGNGGLDDGIGTDVSRTPSQAIGDWKSPAAGPNGVLGMISRYARGPDYHDVLRQQLKRLLEWVREGFPDCRGRAVVDTAPLLERDFARRAGLGWIGKNTMLINKHRGSYFFLGGLLLDIELQPDEPHAADHCGVCTACLEACPTEAFVGPGWLDARKCISYLTIELRSPMPTELRRGVGDWIFGCDVCQEVCPWNRKDETEPERIDAVEALTITEEEFRKRFGTKALARARRRGLARNAAIVLGNSGDPSNLPVLHKALDDPEELVRDAAAWAIARIEESHYKDD